MDRKKMIFNRRNYIGYLYSFHFMYQFIFEYQEQKDVTLLKNVFKVYVYILKSIQNITPNKEVKNIIR